jgi:hypothetical protein
LLSFFVKRKPISLLFLRRKIQKPHFNQPKERL